MGRFSREVLEPKASAKHSKAIEQRTTVFQKCFFLNMRGCGSYRPDVDEQLYARRDSGYMTWRVPRPTDLSGIQSHATLGYNPPLYSSEKSKTFLGYPVAQVASAAYIQRSSITQYTTQPGQSNSSFYPASFHIRMKTVQNSNSDTIHKNET